MTAHHEIARLRNDRDDLQEQVRCLTEVISELARHPLHNPPGFTTIESRMHRCPHPSDGSQVSR